jgi:DNA polymerase-3 subunit epsilon
MTEDDFIRCLEGTSLDGAGALLAEDLKQREASASPAASSTPSRLRSLPLGQRPEPQTPKPSKPPKPLRRTPVPTDQVCSIEGCDSTAAFKTRTKPTWCAEHIQDIQRIGGLRPLESFTHPDDWQLTECLTCTVQAHYRFTYTLEKND